MQDTSLPGGHHATSSPRTVTVCGFRRDQTPQLGQLTNE
jgi:hypothetical protein